MRVQAERAVAMQDQHLLVGLGHLGADAERQADAHRAEDARVQPVARHEGRDRLAAEVQDLLAVDDEDGVAVEEVADLFAEPQRMDRLCVGAHRCFLLLCLACSISRQVLRASRL